MLDSVNDAHCKVISLWLFGLYVLRPHRKLLLLLASDRGSFLHDISELQYLLPDHVSSYLVMDSDHRCVYCMRTSAKSSTSPVGR